MSRRFWLGFMTGATIMKPSQAGAVAVQKQRLEKTSVVSERLAGLGRDLTLAREQASALARASEELNAQIAQLEGGVKDTGAENIRLKDNLARMPAAGRKAAATPDPREELANLRVMMKAGKELPAEVATYLGLNDGQRKLVSDRLKAEGTEIYAVLRRFASEDPSAVLPAADGPGVVVALQTSPGYSEDMRKINKAWDADPAFLTGEKKLYMEDVLDPTSQFVRVAEASLQVRARTLEDLAPILSVEQHQKLASLLGTSRYNFDGCCCSFAWPPPRRPR